MCEQTMPIVCVDPVTSAAIIFELIVYARSINRPYWSDSFGRIPFPENFFLRRWSLVVFLDRSNFTPSNIWPPLFVRCHSIRSKTWVRTFKVSEKPPHASKSICVSIKGCFHFWNFWSRNINDGIIIFFGNNFD